MARGRFISNTLGGSKKFSRLQNDTHRLAYVLLVTHTDVEGRIEAYPPLLKGYAYTLLDWTHNQIQTALEDMHRVGLIHLYIVDDEQYAQVTDFAKHNKIRKDRESGSKIPSPLEDSGRTPADTATMRGSTPSQVEVEVEVEVEGEVEVKEEVEVQDHTPTRESSEERFASTLTGGTTANDTHRVRNTIRRIHADFAKRNEDAMQSWAHWTNQQIQDLWDASDPKKWPGERDKKRSWIFADLLNQDRTPPTPPPPKRDIVREAFAEIGALDLLEELDAQDH